MEKNDNDILERLISLDNGGRRSGGDRRNYSYTLHIPERRDGNDRRNGEDRRKIPRTKANPWNWLSEDPSILIRLDMGLFLFPGVNPADRLLRFLQSESNPQKDKSPNQYFPLIWNKFQNTKFSI